MRYAYGASVEDAMEKLQYDLFYLKNMSLALDVVIAFETAAEIAKSVKARGILAEPTVSRFDRNILIGFIERVSVPKLIGR